MRAVRYVVIAAAVLGACHAGGEYVQGDRMGGEDRGETNGRQFDFVVNKPDGDEWTLRVRGSSFWVAHPHDEKTDDLGTVNLDDKETKKVWAKIDALDMANRKKGKKDDDAGFVQLRLREPGDESKPGVDDQHDLYNVFVSRETDDDDVTGLAEYLRGLVKKYHKIKADF